MAEEKILKDEIMSEQELDQVAGGNRDELALDTQLFNAMGERFKAYALDDITSSNVNVISSKISQLWSDAGLRVEYNDNGASKYFDGNGKQITRNQAVDKLAYNLGYHKLDTAPFKIF